MADEPDNNDNPMGQLHEERERRRLEREEQNRRDNPNPPDEEDGLLREMINNIRDDGADRRGRQKRARDEGFCGAL
jgi:hypothetical protein